MKFERDGAEYIASTSLVLRINIQIDVSAVIQRNPQSIGVTNGPNACEILQGLGLDVEKTHVVWLVWLARGLSPKCGEYCGEPARALLRIVIEDETSTAWAQFFLPPKDTIPTPVTLRVKIDIPSLSICAHYLIWHKQKFEQI